MHLLCARLPVFILPKEKKRKKKWIMEKKFDEKIELDRKKVKEIVPQKFHKWLKVFRKVELERIPMKKL